MARRSCSTAINTSPLISVLLGDADDQRGAGCFDDIIGDGGQLVDLHDPLHLGEQPVDEAEVAAGDPGDRGDGLGRKLPAIALTFKSRREHRQLGSHFLPAQ